MPVNFSNRLPKITAFLLLLTCCLALPALAEKPEGWSTYAGAWFSVYYPSTFEVVPSIVSETHPSFYDSAFFNSPDGSVSFYIYAPQWNGEAEDIALQDNEKIIGDKTIVTDEKIVREYTIKANNRAYLRSYIDSESLVNHTRLVIGIKYKNIDVYNRYRSMYLQFKNTLEQYAD
jgi:hypothetical protein